MSESNTETYPRASIGSDNDPGRLRRAFDTLQDTIRQPVQTVTRSASLQTSGGNVEDIDPPEDIDELVELYYDIGFLRKNLNEFVSDVTEPGLQVQAEDDATQAYFMGGDGAPEGAPEAGFVSEAYVIDEKRQHLDRGLELCVLDRWRRGTVMVEKVYDDPGDADSIITGFKHIRPETVSARTYENTNQLIDPDDLENADETTKRDEAAAYVQFDEQSILGRRTNRRLFQADDTSIPLSQNDVVKETLNQDIGGDDAEEGVFGESIIRSVRDAAEEYRDISRDEAEAVRRIAFGFHTIQFNDYVLEAGDETILVEWDESEIGEAETEIENLDPGGYITTDAQVELNRFQPDLPDLESPLRRRVREMIDPLPAPFYKHSFADEINQFVTDDQQEDYQDLIRSERHLWAQAFEAVFRDVAERHDDLDSTGITVRIEPDENDSPIRTLDETTIQSIKTLSEALNTLSGQLSPMDVFGEETIRELVAMLPEEEGETADTLKLDEGNEQVQQQFERLLTNGGQE